MHGIAVLGEINTTQKYSKRRRDNIGHEGRNDLSKGSTNDNSDSQINYVSLEGEVFEVRKEGHWGRNYSAYHSFEASAVNP